MNSQSLEEQPAKKMTKTHKTASSSKPPPMENILDLKKYTDKGINVKYSNGTEINGVLKGFDSLMNLVVDEVEMDGRKLGLVICRGTQISMISPLQGMHEISNPFE